MKVRNLAAASLVAMALTLSACSGSLPGATSSDSGAPADLQLDLGLSSDLSAPDPSSAFDGSEINLVLAAYEGLVKYESGAEKPNIVPALATEWQVSDDGLTYSFKLREGVKFHDGVAFTSAAVQPSIDRMAKEGASGPGYMVGDIATVETPSDLEVVLKLKQPNAAFLDYLASPFGLKMISPEALAEHGNDADWFAANDAGTGPYKYGKFEPGVGYQLDQSDEYWGENGGFTSIKYQVLDSSNTIQLKLESGELDGYVGSANKPMYEALVGNEKLQTTTYPSMMMPVVYLNPNTDYFSETQTRVDFLAGIDWAGIVETVYGDLGEVTEAVFPSNLVDTQATVNPATADLAALSSGALGGKTVKIGYPSFVPGAQEIADNMTAQLNAAGIKSESAGYESGAYWSTVYDPAAAPDVTLFSAFPDAGHPDTWGRLLFHSAGGLNLFQAKVPEIDKTLDEALVAGDTEAYTSVANLVNESGYWRTVADLDVWSAFQLDVEGVENASYPVVGITFDYTALSPQS